MTKTPSKTYCAMIRKMTNRELLSILELQNSTMDALEKERQECWRRMQEIGKRQDVLGGKRQMVAATCRARNIC
jgi:hypothetical protein